MAYIQPNSRIEFFTDLGLSQDYNDTLFFETEHDKDLYFDNVPNRLAYVDKCYYARENRGFVRVELPMSTMISAQYMRFKNTSYENKWWYAFVKDVNYINDNTTEVQFELDTMLTWMGDFTLSQCFVERQHSLTDEIGENLVDEPVNTGEYVTIGDYETDLFSEWCYVIFMSPTVLGSFVDMNTSQIGIKLGLYNGLAIRIYEDDSDLPNTNTPPYYGRPSLGHMNEFLHTSALIENVQMVCYVPKAFIPRIFNYQPPYEGAYDFGDENRPSVPIEFTRSIYRNTALDGNYQPKNNKLFTFPFNFFTVWNSEGKEDTYRYELFGDNASRPYFKILSQISEKTEVSCIPMNYRGISLNYAESTNMKEFPLCSWVSDAWCAFLAQTLSSSAVRILTGVSMDALTENSNTINMSRTATVQNEKSYSVTGEANFWNGNQTRTTVRQSEVQNENRPLGHHKSAYATDFAIRGSLLDGIYHLATPSSAHGPIGNDIMSYQREKNFWFYKKSVRAEYAKMIDDYFTMFGYAQKRIMTPQMNVRPYFTYVKTVGCKINCECPASDANTIEEIFNKGIRFWKRHTDIGHYEVNNAPMQGGNP